MRTPVASWREVVNLKAKGLKTYCHWGSVISEGSRDLEFSPVSPLEPSAPRLILLEKGWMYWIWCQPSRVTVLPAFPCHHDASHVTTLPTFPCHRTASLSTSLQKVHFTVGKRNSRCCNPFPLSLKQYPFHQEGFQSFSSQTSFLQILRFSHSFLSLVLTSRGTGAGGTLAYLSVLLGLLMQKPEQQQLQHSGGCWRAGSHTDRVTLALGKENAVGWPLFPCSWVSRLQSSHRELVS